MVRFGDRHAAQEVGIYLVSRRGLARAGMSMIALFDVVRSEVFDGLPGSASRAL
jgi:hypothetical protein